MTSSQRLHRANGSISSAHNSRSSEPRCLIDFNDDDSANLSISSSNSDSSDGSIPDLDDGSNSDDNSDSDDESMPGLLTRHTAMTNQAMTNLTKTQTVMMNPFWIQGRCNAKHKILLIRTYHGCISVYMLRMVGGRVLPQL